MTTGVENMVEGRTNGSGTFNDTTRGLAPDGTRSNTRLLCRIRRVCGQNVGASVVAHDFGVESVPHRLSYRLTSDSRH